MTQAAQAGTRPAATSTFDWASWRPSLPRCIAAAAVLAFSADLLLDRRGGQVLLGVVITIETLLLLLPWRLPRRVRSAASFWAESAVALLTPVAATIIAAVTRPAWLTAGCNPLWYAAAIGVAALLTVIDGVRLPAVLSGELSFIAGPTPVWFRRARATSIAAGPVGEEVAFRGTALLAAGDPLVATLATLAFIARHHVQPGSNGRGTPRAWAVEVVGAAAFMAITLLSRSIYPAMAAHVLFNLPGFVTEMRRDNE